MPEYNMKNITIRLKNDKKYEKIYMEYVQKYR